jgi:serine protease Do
MNHEASKRLTAILLLVLFAMACILVGETPVQAAVGAALSGNALQEDFHKAHADFLKKDYRDAASEVRQAATLIKNEAGKATAEAKQELTESAQELFNLADRINKRAVTSEKELADNFARAENALALHYHAKASESWANKEVSQAGQYLKGAATYLENALTSAGSRIEKKSKKIIQEAKDLGEKMETAMVAAGPDVEKHLAAIKKEILETAHKQPFSRSAGGFLQISEKGADNVDLSTSIITIANQTMPAVVYIEVTESQVVENPLWQFQGNPFFRRFFGMPKMPRKFKQEMKGLGSGMIINAGGDILTNYHVAGGARKIQVTLADGSHYPAKLVGGDQKTDLAVIHISAAKPLPYVTFGDSDKIEVGEWVVAIGAPRALEKSVTQGIISAKHRTSITDPDTYEDFLQTDAAINPGNSGGPLLNLYGQVIGVNAAIASSSGGFEGIGFTIPSRMVVYIANALMSHGKVERGWLGVSIRDLTPELARAVNGDRAKGALVVNVAKGGPAEKGGLKKNDVIVAYGGKDIPDSATLRNDVAQTPVGRQLSLTILRDGKKENVTVTVENLDEAAKVLAVVVKERLGAEVRLPTPKEIEQYGLDKNQGVLITWLDPKGPLGEAGFEVGDMILVIDKQPVDGMDNFIAQVESLTPGMQASLVALDHRTGNTGTILVVIR